MILRCTHSLLQAFSVVLSEHICLFLRPQFFLFYAQNSTCIKRSGCGVVMIQFLATLDTSLITSELTLS